MILQVKGIPVFYKDEGKGDVVILLHGFLENSTMWTDIKPTLLESHRVICVDLLGHGQTGCLGYIHTMSDMANTVLVVLNHLKIKQYTIIGHSMGGYVALALAESKPSAILGICLMNSTYYADDNDRIELRRRANKLAQNNYEAMVRMSFTNLFSSESKTTHKKELESALIGALKTPLQGYMAAQEGMCIREDKLEFYMGLNAKKTIIIGLKDPVVDSSRILRETNDSSIVCHQLSHGHMSHIENKSELTYIIRRFIE